MEQNFTLCSEPGNPWNVQDKATSALQKALALGENTGHVAKKLEYTGETSLKDADVSLPSFKLIKILKSMSSTKAEHPSGICPAKLEYTGETSLKDADVSLPSFKLIKILKSMSSTKAELNKINLEIQCRMQDKETSDITHLDILEKRIAHIKNLNSHLESIIDSKDQLIQRLQQPFKGDYLKLEAQYHRFASELFPQITPLLSDLTTNLENIVWTKSLSVSDGKIDAMITELCSVLGAMQTSFQSFCQIQQSMGQLHQLQTGTLHSTKLEDSLSL